MQERIFLAREHPGLIAIRRMPQLGKVLIHLRRIDDTVQVAIEQTENGVNHGLRMGRVDAIVPENNSWRGQPSCCATKQGQ
jgi:hypothetical protein